MHRMETKGRWGAGLAMMALALLPGFAAAATHPAHVKPAAYSGPAARAGLAAQMGTVETVEVSSSPARAVREIDDQATGVRWLLVRDEVHPAGPGKWIRVGMAVPELRDAGTKDVEMARADLQQNLPQFRETQTEDAAVKPPAPILIRGGDPIIVEQSTPVLTARLEAVALEPAIAGKLFQARLKATHARVWVIALGPGEATLAPPGVVGR